KLSCQHSVGHSKLTAGDKPEEGGDDVISSCPLCCGLHTCYNGQVTKGSDAARPSESHKTVLSSDWRLQLDSMQLESLVIVDQHATGNTLPGLVHTARRTTKDRNTCSRWAKLDGGSRGRGG